MSFILALFVFVAWGYWIYAGRSATARGTIALLMSVFGALAAYDGVTLAVREYGRANDGVVTSGLVVGKLSSTGADGSQTVRAPRSRRSRSFVMADGFGIHDELARLILTGSTTAWVVDYRYGCARSQGCSGRDFVPEAFWRRISVGQAINVRRWHDETRSSRLDGNPQWAVAIVDLSFAAVLLLIAAGVCGRLTPPRRRYLTAPAVVTAVEPVKYRDVTRWRVRFAYFDQTGVAQESADEVVKDA